MDKLLTVIVQTSPIPSHASTALLEALFRSFCHADGFLESTILIVCDGCQVVKEQSGETENHKHGKASLETAQRYREHLVRLRHAVDTQQPPFVPHQNGSIKLLELERRHGSACAIQAAFVKRKIQTPLVMVCQHDNFFIHTVPFRACVHAMVERPGLGVGVQCLHFLSTATLNYQEKIQKRYHMDISKATVEIHLDNNTRKFQLVPLVFWYGRSHLSYTDHYRNTILNNNHRPLQVGDHLEELLGVAQLHDIQRRGMETAFSDYGTYVLDPGDGKEVIYHLSGRRVRAAATTTTEQQQQQQQDATMGHEEGATISPQEKNDTTTIHPQQQGQPPGSFTTARSCRAIVPGLEIVSDYQDNNNQSTTANKAPKGRFKQKCFHCGNKGHSYKYCPNMTNNDTPNTETIDLS
ncbi:expressed unknown protein [Seminavis robusta]|uniref:CCHC-type domain-containing protein n=1 Tax=Seminavis robusta TaxID=568900 RepID=A0A9N8ETH9_9STRA|nr:expressed unknown protein [Seminavis robusta]|eukprot:Sro1772_g296730.1 n/a (409) ;mRNA; r:19589-20815